MDTGVTKMFLYNFCVLIETREWGKQGLQTAKGAAGCSCGAQEGGELCAESTGQIQEFCRTQGSGNAFT